MENNVKPFNEHQLIMNSVELSLFYEIITPVLICMIGEIFEILILVSFFSNLKSDSFY